MGRISRNGIRSIMNKVLTACDLKHPGYSCHVFQRSCDTNLYHETKDLRLVQDVLRHRDPKITARYAHAADRLTKRYTSKKENLSLSSMRYNFSPCHDRPSYEFSVANFIPKEKSMPNLAPTFLWVFLIQFFFRNKGYDTIFILLFQIKRWLSTLDYLVLYGRYIYWGR
jgi:hypothetical protein